MVMMMMMIIIIIIMIMMMVMMLMEDDVLCLPSPIDLQLNLLRSDSNAKSKTQGSNISTSSEFSKQCTSIFGVKSSLRIVCVILIKYLRLELKQNCLDDVFQAQNPYQAFG